MGFIESVSSKNGDTGVFAFYPNKQITTGEGGSNCGCRIAECGLDQSTAGGNNRWKTTLNSIHGCLKVIDIFRSANVSWYPPLGLLYLR